MKHIIKTFENYDYKPDIISPKLKDLDEIKKYMEDNYAMGNFIKVLSFKPETENSDLYELKVKVDDPQMDTIYTDWFLEKDDGYYHVD